MGQGRYDRLPELATELSQSNVELVVAYGSEGALAAKRSISTIPVVAVSVGDFIGAGIVANLARPEANVTGLSLLATGISEKRLSLLRETLPRLGKVAILWNPGNASVVLKFKAAQAAAHAMGIHALDLQYSSAAQLARTIPTAVQAGADALFTADDLLLVAHATKISGIARDFRLPSSASSGKLQKRAGSGATDQTSATSFAAQPSMSTNSSMARSPAICLSSNRRNSS